MEGSGDDFELPQLDLVTTIGYQGAIKNGLHVHPDRDHIIYGVGQTLVVKNITNDKEYCLRGHYKEISCIAMSKDGAFIASGEKSFMGFKAEVIIWDFETKQRHGSHSIHKVKVEAVSFSCKNDYLVSLGGQDCRSVVVYNVKGKYLVCGNPSSMFIGGYPTYVKCANTNNTVFVTAGQETLRLWRIDAGCKRVFPTNVPLGNLKREFLCIEINPNDEYMYCGTTTGDVLKFHLNLLISKDVSAESAPKLMYTLRRTLPVVEKEKTTTRKSIQTSCRSSANDKVLPFTPFYRLGVTAILALKQGDLVIGTGEGVVSRCRETELLASKDSLQKIVEVCPATSKPIQAKSEMRLLELISCKLLGPVGVLTMRGDGHQFFVGTKNSEIYRILLTNFNVDLLYTCHGASVNDVAFPAADCGLFVTCSTESIRIWNTLTAKELLRITLPNMICNSVCFSRDGQTIISGWNDGKIRVYTPESGALLFVINDAHQRGVTAIAGTSDCQEIVSGGGEGEVRVWRVNPLIQVLNATMKEHKGSVTAVKIKSDDLECVTSGEDGSCIIWDLKRFLRLQVFLANTIFKSVCYGPYECQVLTCGTDHKIAYWEVSDGSAIRELEGSVTGPVNALGISKDCKYFVSGGNDKILKFWNYDHGIVTHVGQGHSDQITAIAISPKMKYIVSVSKDGSIFIWHYPVRS